MNSDINIFISHCHANEEDQKFLNELLKFIRPVVNNMDGVSLWSDKEVLTGMNLENSIQEKLKHSNLMICLVSPDYLNSKYCIEKELKSAIEKKQIDKPNIFPIILRNCVWQYTYFGEILCQPKDGKPLKDFPDLDNALTEIVGEFVKVLTCLKENQAEKQIFPIVANDRESLVVSEPTKLENYLNNLGIHIVHSSKDSLSLNEIFVYPDIRVISDNATIQKHIWTPQDVLSTFDYIYFMGTEEIGKTSLLKKLAQDYLEKGKKVVILNGRNIKKTSLNSLILQFQEEYGIDDLPPYSELTVFIDDFEKQNLKPQHLDKLLIDLCEQFSQVIIFIDKKEYLQSQSRYIRHNFVEAEILPFGFKKRSEIIKKWVLLDSENKESMITDEEFSRIDLITRNFDSIMKKNIMDSRPIYIITIIQTLENMSYTNGSFALTSYGQCYHVLMTGMLTKAKVALSDLDGVSNFLSYFAYYLYKLKIDSISEEEFEEVIDKYSQQYVPPNDIKKILLNSGILVSANNDSLRFSQKYLYYFSCSKHISDNSKLLKTDISDLCENIHNEHNANILIFLVHHLRGTDLLDEIMAHAICLLDHIKTFDMSLDAVQGYKQILGDRLKNITIDESKTAEDQRSELLEKADQLERELEEITPVSYALDSNQLNSKVLENTDEFNILQQATSALRSIDVLGQIAKNRHSSIQISELKEILSSTYNISLKVLNFYLSIFNENEEELEDLLMNVLLDSNKDIPISEARESAQNLIHNFIYSICYYMIQLVSQSTAHSKLISISTQLSQADEASAAYKLINLHSQLLINTELPKPLIRSIKKEYANNNLVCSLLGSIVANHAYLHNLNFRDKQWIQDELKITVSKQLKSNSHNRLTIPLNV